jgi:hypothetical protein
MLQRVFEFGLLLETVMVLGLCVSEGRSRGVGVGGCVGLGLRLRRRGFGALRWMSAR